MSYLTMSIQEVHKKEENESMNEIDRYLREINETQRIIDSIDINHDRLVQIHEDRIRHCYEMIRLNNELITSQRDIYNRYIERLRFIG